MSKIKLRKRFKWSFDIAAALEDIGWTQGEAINFCDEIPDTDADEVVHGEWDFDVACEPYCSICGKYALNKGFDKFKSLYCPFCGARMRNGEDNG